MDCNEYFELAEAIATVDARQQLFEYVFRVKRSLPWPCFIFEHFSNDKTFFPSGQYPLVPTTHWQPPSYVHRTRQFIPPGDYDWWVGMTHGESDHRLGIEGTEDDRVYLGRVRVEGLSVPAAAAAVRSERTVLPELHRHQIQVYASEQGEVVACPQHGDSRHKVAVVSMPKSGTYLLAKLVAELGFCNCGLHLSHSHFEDYRNATVAEGDDVRHFIRAYHTTQLVSPGQSIVGHVKHCLETRVALAGFKKIFVYRNLRDAVVSHARFEIKLGRQIAASGDGGRSALEARDFAKILARTGPDLRQKFAAVLAWRDEPDVLPVQFEQLLGDRGVARQHKCVAAVARHLGVELPKRQVAALLERVVGRETMTYSGQRSDWRQSWNEDVERTFEAVGLKELNRRLGYEGVHWPVGVWKQPAAFGRRFARLMRSRRAELEAGS